MNVLKVKKYVKQKKCQLPRAIPGTSTTATLLGAFCGQRTVAVSSTANAIYFVARSDSSITDSGYSFNYFYSTISKAAT